MHDQHGPAVGVVILHWYSGHATIDAIRSALASKDVRVTVYLVNNGSHRGDEAEWKRFQSLVILGDGRNRGFSAGANLGARRALSDGADYVFLLNSDAVIQPDTLARLIAAGGGAANPRILNAQGGIWFDAGNVTFRGRGVSQWPGRTSAPRNVSFVTGCALLLKKGTLERVGFFDEQLFAYGEDVDFSIRASERGIPLVADPRVTVIHRESLSVKRVAGKAFRDYYVIRNMLLVVRKHTSGTGFWIRAAIVLVVEFLVPSLFLAASLQPGRILALARGFFDGMRGRSGESQRYPGAGV